MLLAAGIKSNSQKAYEIVPIIIDPHKSNEDLKRTERLLGNYQKIRKEGLDNNGFFATDITTLNNIIKSKNRISESFTFNLLQVSNTRFKEYIDFNQLNEPSRAMADLLFSGKSINKRGEEVDLLDVEMDIGFVGNPNIGSVVLNQFKDSNEFREFASNFNAEDRIFIISSIFGGTGAAGFPTILKNIRDAINNQNIDGRDFLRNSKIGAITVLPYFNIEKDTNSPIQKSDFIAKSKAALYYYKDNVTGNNSINALYYIADDYSGKPYKNDPGDNGQKNDAHFIELASALAIIDFLEIPDSDLETNEGKALKPIYKEFGIRNNSTSIKFSDFEDFTERKVALRLSQFALFWKYVTEHLNKAIEKEAWCIDKPEIDRKFVDDTFFRSNLKEFLESFNEWITEMAENKRGFAPINLSAEIESIIQGRTIQTSWLSKNINYGFYDNKLSKKSKGKTFKSPALKLLELFFEATEDILITKFGLKK